MDGTIEIQSNTGGVVTTWTRRRFQPNWITQCSGESTKNTRHAFKKKK